MLPIVQAPNTVLSQPTKRINKIDNAIRTLIKEMIVTLENTRDPEGVGLAAPQVGESLQLFIIKESPNSPLFIFINPEIKTMSDEKHDKNKPENGQSKRKKEKGVKLEGCLSLKDIWGIVNRAETVTLAYQDETGTQQEKTFGGFMATIVQHEFDHLQGILFPKRVIEQNEKLYKTVEDENGETVFEEIEI